MRLFIAINLNDEMDEKNFFDEIWIRAFNDKAWQGGAAVTANF